MEVRCGSAAEQLPRSSCLWGGACDPDIDDLGAVLSRSLGAPLPMGLQQRRQPRRTAGVIRPQPDLDGAGAAVILGGARDYRRGAGGELAPAGVGERRHSPRSYTTT